MKRQVAGLMSVLCGLLVFGLMVGSSTVASAQQWVPYTGAVQKAHAVTPPVSSLPKAPLHPGPAAQVPLFHRPAFVSAGQQAPVTDPAVQKTSGTSPTAFSRKGFDGVGFNGYYPPDPNISVGGPAAHEQIVQTTNVEFAVYATDGTLLSGPTLLNSLFSSLSGTLCASNNGGDPVVLWDKIAQRWLISQLAYPNSLKNVEECIAISQTSDATGAYNAYGFTFPQLPDYPKFGVWPSSSASGTSDYYFSANLFSRALYYGPVVCAFNGSDMQSGTATPRYACSQGPTSDFSLLPSDFDGTPPGPGEPNYFLELSSGGVRSSGNSLIMYPFLASWTGSSGSLNNPSAITIPVSAYNVACSNGGACVPQPGTNTQVDSLGDRLMYRLAFRDNLSTDGHETLVATHSVNRGDGVVGMRWYEINSATGATFADSASSGMTVKQGTFSGTDNNYRWMGSIAQDKNGNTALGYSISNGNNLFPSINFTGKASTDSAMQAETTLKSGTGSETGASRWGDYTSLSVDPADDCTFWYVNEYFTPNAASGIAWNTFIGSFAFSGCSGSSSGSAPSAPTNLTATPGDGQVSLSWTASSGATSYNVLRSTTSGGESGVLVNVTSTSYTDTGVTNGTTYYYVVQAVNNYGTSGDSNEASATPTAASSGDFTISASPPTNSTSQNSTATYTVSVGSSGGFTGDVSLSVSGAPPQSSASFSPASITGGSGSSTLTISTGRHTPTKTYTLTIAGTSGSLIHTATVSLTVQ